MRIINLIVVHCSATREDCTLSPEDIRTLTQRATPRKLVGKLHEKFPGCQVYGYRVTQHIKKQKGGKLWQ
ncbi:hypothetical protein [Bacteroides sp. AM16-13]|uniref:hypothetical protein n=1 Tax=Bacteroides sp. AM16-13 TaxID=2292938 RepID=UPI000E71E222|nr:hypothetical protein [Bacteroides sp. AM16-13]RGD47220.1 hypothetical protein DW173_23415 [Bacteroides sp. AM16-13]